MAKNKMTLEEKLEEAIVKDFPYEVPENWVWTNVGSISLEIKNGTTIKQNKDESGIKVTRIESLQNNGIDLNRLGTIIETDKIKEQDYYVDGDIALSHINSLEHVGKTALIDNSLLPLVHGMNLLRIRVDKNLILPKYFQLYTRGYDYKKFVVDRVNRAVNQVSLNQKNLSDVPMPIPPLKEQQRIVDKVESLFEKLDKAKELIEEARDDFEKRKSAILEKAFRGELTKEWRMKKNIDYKDSWKSGIFEDLCVLSRGFDLPSKLRVEGEYLLVSSSGVIDSHNEAKMRAPGVVTGRSGSIGKVFYIENDFWPLNTTLYVKDFKDNYEKYVYYYLSKFDFKKYSSSTAVPTLNRNNFKSVSIMFPCLEEQKEIVRILDKLLEGEAKIEELTSLEEQIELIKKSILAKAFRGKLGTNCEEDESALELLKEILKDK